MSILRVIELLGYEHDGIEQPHKIYCPCHSDANKSAKVYPHTDTIYCFAMSKAYSAAGLYAKFHDITTREAYKLLVRQGIIADTSRAEYLITTPDTDDFLVPTQESLEKYKQFIPRWAIQLEVTDIPVRRACTVSLSQYPEGCSDIDRRLTIFSNLSYVLSRVQANRNVS